MTAAGAQPPGPRLPNSRGATVSWRRKRKDRPRRRPRVAVARPGRSHGEGAGACGPGAGHIPRLPSGRHLSRGNGLEPEKRDHQEKTRIGDLPRRAGQAPGKKGSGYPVPRASCGGRISHQCVCLRTSLTRGGVRRLPSPGAQSASCTVLGLGLSARTGRLPSAGTLRVLRGSDPLVVRLSSGR
jgi:hypothetical protein